MGSDRCEIAMAAVIWSWMLRENKQMNAKCMGRPPCEWTTMGGTAARVDTLASGKGPPCDRSARWHDRRASGPACEMTASDSGGTALRDEDTVK